MKKLENYITWTRINSDVNGNPRFVCHFLAFKPYQDPKEAYIGFEYEEALKVAKTLGGRKFHNKQYGGGIVFQSYNINDITERILLLTGDAITCSRQPTKGEIKFGHGATHYKTFLKKELLNKKGELKKWFKCPNDGLN